jgi:putative FmdB family regulatory protein
MPLYDYACRQCDHTFEALVHDGEAVVCPQCQAQNPERLLSLPARPAVADAPRTCGADPSVPPCGPMCQRWK